MELVLVEKKYLRVKRGQRIGDIARAYGIPACVLSKENALQGEVYAGQVLSLGIKRHDLYTVKGGESKSLLCGSPERFEALNATKRIYPGQTVWL